MQAPYGCAEPSVPRPCEQRAGFGVDRKATDEVRMTAKPTIARIWRGRVKTDRADQYAQYLHENGVKKLAEKALGVQQFREDRDGESEFTTISYWENVEAMSRYAGSDPRKIHHLPRDEEFLIELPESVQVLTITASFGKTGW
jgi:heme-degrading monooxygenase HmoA